MSRGESTDYSSSLFPWWHLFENTSSLSDTYDSAKCTFRSRLDIVFDDGNDSDFRFPFNTYNISSIIYIIHTTTGYLRVTLHISLLCYYPRTPRNANPKTTPCTHPPSPSSSSMLKNHRLPPSAE